jgi:sec-independent protein translocase protein TatC
MGAITSPPRQRFRVRLPGRGVLQIVRPGERASAITHLEELRWRLIVVLSALVVAFAVAYTWRELLFELLNRPLGSEYRIQTLSVTEPFFTSITVAANAAFIIVFPIAVFHCYRFVSPALEPEHRRTIRAISLIAPALFVLGVAFSYLLVLAPAMSFLLGFGGDSFDVVVRAQDYYRFVVMTLLASGLAFLFPLVLIGLGQIGVLSPATLRAKRKVALVLIAVVAALLPTADPVSLALEILPLIALYELSIWVLVIQDRAARRRSGRISSQ